MQIQPQVIKAVIILDSTGKRIHAKYFNVPDLGTVEQQMEFEKKLFAKTSKSKSSSGLRHFSFFPAAASHHRVVFAVELTLYQQFVVAHASAMDCFFHVLGASSENELIVCTFLESLLASITDLVKTKYVSFTSVLLYLCDLLFAGPCLSGMDKKPLRESLAHVILVVDGMVDQGCVCLRGEHDACVFQFRFCVRMARVILDIGPGVSKTLQGVNSGDIASGFSQQTFSQAFNAATKHFMSSWVGQNS